MLLGLECSLRSTRQWMLALRLIQGLLLVTLFPLAHATPPDPLRIAGIYDGADHDDVVGMLADEGLALSTNHKGIEPLATNLRSPNSSAESRVVVTFRSTLRLRSPPSH